MEGTGRGREGRGGVEGKVAGRQRQGEWEKDLRRGKVEGRRRDGGNVRIKETWMGEGKVGGQRGKRE